MCEDCPEERSRPKAPARTTTVRSSDDVPDGPLDPPEFVRCRRGFRIQCFGENGHFGKCEPGR